MATVPLLDFSPLSQLGQTYQKARKEQTLAELGKGLSDGSIDYKQAAGIVSSTGDLDATTKFLALAQAAEKQKLQQQAGNQFSTDVGGMFGGQQTPQQPVMNLASLSAGAPVTTPRAVPVQSSPRVWGDKEAEAAGLYEKPAAAVAQVAPRVETMPQVAPQPFSGTPQAQSPQIGVQHIPKLLQAVANPNLPDGQKDLAKTLLTRALDSSKPNERIQMLTQMKEQSGFAGTVLELEERIRGAGKTTVNVDTKGENELAKKLGGGLGERINDIAKEGDAARTDLAMVGQLRDLGATIKTGGPAAVQGWLAGYGIKVGENVGAIEAYGSIVDKLTPNQRVPGSGSSSDVDVKMFKSSLPRLINTPEGNTIIENTLSGLAQYKLDRAAIADKVQIGELTAKDAIKLMRELPNPYDNFKTFAKTGFKASPNNPASTGQAPSPAAPKMSTGDMDSSLSNAKAAIAAGAPRDAVIKKLRDAGINPDGL